VPDQQQKRSGSGCGAWLAWFLAVGIIRSIGRELGWSDRAQLFAVLGLLLLVVIVIAVRQQPNRQTKPQRDSEDGQP
jgi:predicted MFS family arabinose efflux permease